MEAILQVLAGYCTRIRVNCKGLSQQDEFILTGIKYCTGGALPDHANIAQTKFRSGWAPTSWAGGIGRRKQPLTCKASMVFAALAEMSVFLSLTPLSCCLWTVYQYRFCDLRRR